MATGRDSINEAKNALNDLKGAVENIKIDQPKEVEFRVKGIEQFKELTKTLKEISGFSRMPAKVFNVKSEKELKDIEKIRSAFERLREEHNKLEWKDNGDYSQILDINKYNKAVNEFINAVKNSNKRIQNYIGYNLSTDPKRNLNFLNHANNSYNSEDFKYGSMEFLGAIDFGKDFDAIAERSAAAIAKEAQKAEEAKQKMSDASKAKDEFANSNKRVASSAEESSSKVESEAKAADDTKKKMDEATKSAENLAKGNQDTAKSADEATKKLEKEYEALRQVDNADGSGSARVRVPDGHGGFVANQIKDIRWDTQGNIEERGVITDFQQIQNRILAMDKTIRKNISEMSQKQRNYPGYDAEPMRRLIREQINYRKELLATARVQAQEQNYLTRFVQLEQERARVRHEGQARTAGTDAVQQAKEDTQLMSRYQQLLSTYKNKGMATFTGRGSLIDANEFTRARTELERIHAEVVNLQNSGRLNNQQQEKLNDLLYQEEQYRQRIEDLRDNHQIQISNVNGLDSIRSFNNYISEGNLNNTWLQGATVTAVQQSNALDGLIVSYINAQGAQGRFLMQTQDGQTTMTQMTGEIEQQGRSLGFTIAQNMAYYISLRSLFNYVRNGINTLKEYNNALTSISYTMDIDSTALNNLGREALDMSEKLGVATENAMEIVQIYANMNTSAQEMLKTAEPTAILSNLTGIDARAAANDIQSVLQQFEKSADDAMHIADVYDYISGQIAVDYSQGIENIASGVQIVGDTARQAGLSFEELSAIIAKVSERTRMEGSQIANGLKTIMVRTSKVGELSDEVDNETLSKASASLKEIGIDVYNADGSYRHFNTIMGELAEKWDSLNDAQKANLSFNIAATRQTNLLSAVLNTYGDAMDIATDAVNAQGNAVDNNEKYLESYAGLLTQISNEVERFQIEMLDNDMTKGILEIIKDVLGWIDKAVAGLNNFGSGLGTATAAVGMLTGAFVLLRPVLTSTNATGNMTLELFRGLYRQFNNTDRAIKGPVASFRELAAATREAGGGFKGLKIAIGANPLSAIVVGITAAIAAFYALDKAIGITSKTINEKFDKARQKVNDLTGEIDQIDSKLQELKSEIEEIQAKDSFSLADENDLKILQEETQELREQRAIKQQERAEAAREELKNANKLFNGKITYYALDDQFNGRSDRSGTKIDMLKYYLNRDPNSTFNGHALKDLDSYNNSIGDAIEEVNKLYDSYVELTDAGIALTAEQSSEFNQLKEVREMYFDYLYALNHTKEAYDALSDSSKRAAISQNLVESGLSENFANKVSSQLTSEQLEIAYDVTPISTVDKAEAKNILEEELNEFADVLTRAGLNNSEIKNAQEQLQNGLFTSVFGNIDMNNRQAITWTEELLEKYKDVLEEWGEIPSLGETSTVLGGWDNFGDFEIAFTPMLQTENGAVLMSPEKVSEYIQKLIDYASGDDGKVTIEEILELDKSGKIGYKYGDEIVKGIIAGVTDASGNNSEKFSAPIVSELMHFAGEFGALNLDPVAEDSAEDYIKKWLKEAQDELKKAVLEVPEPTTVFQNVSALGEGLDKLSEIYNDVKDKGKFDYTAVFDDKFVEQFGQYEEEYNKFVEAITNSPDDIGKCEEAFNKLASVYIKNSKALEDVTEETKSATVAMLQQMGVANAEEVVTSALKNNLAEAKRILKITSFDVANASYDEIEAFIKEGQYSDELAEKLRLLAIQEKIAGGALDTTESVNALIRLVEQAGISASAIINLKNIMQEFDSAMANGATINGRAFQAGDRHIYDYYTKQIDKMKSDAITDINNSISNASISNIKDVKFTGGSSTGKDSSSKSGSDSAETFDWVDRAIQKVEKEIDRLDDKASDTWRSWSSRNGALSDELGKVQQQMGQMAAAADYYMQKANAIPLPDYYKNLVMNGGLLIEEIQDETLKKNIKEFQELYMLCNCYLVIGNNKYYLTAGKS